MRAAAATMHEFDAEADSIDEAEARRGRSCPLATRVRRHSPSSDAGSEASEGGGGRTKIYCAHCYDPSNTRCMNFHAECWNIWHGQCHDSEEHAEE